MKKIQLSTILGIFRERAAFMSEFTNCFGCFPSVKCDKNIGINPYDPLSRSPLCSRENVIVVLFFFGDMTVIKNEQEVSFDFYQFLGELKLKLLP